MINRLIKTEEDYEKALYRIEGIIDAELGTPEMDELELLTALVEMYEDRHYPIAVQWAQWGAQWGSGHAKYLI